MPGKWTKHLTKPVKFTFLTEKDRVSKNYGASIHESQAIFIQSSHNGGFAAGNNIGIRLARNLNPDADIWLVNNDTVIVPDTLQHLVEYAGICRKNNDRVGIIGGKLRYYDTPNILQGVCGCYQRWSGMSYSIGGGEIDHGQYDCFQPKQLNFIFSAAMYVMKEFMDDVGLMEEDYFLYFEELDWTIRGMRRNWRIEFCPQALIYHKEGRSIGSHILLSKRSELADYYGIANRIKITKRFFPIFLPTVMAGLGVTFFRRVLSGQWGRACKLLPMAIWKGLFT